MTFDYSLDFVSVNFRKRPELYRIGKGEQGVLLVEPYKSEILPHWRFKTPQIARKSANKIYGLFLDYKAKEDFVGMDMARKFLQMGYTRSRRYANHKSGRKYAAGSKVALPSEKDPVKAKSAKVFYEKWQKARVDEKYLELKKRHRQRYKIQARRGLRLTSGSAVELIETDEGHHISSTVHTEPSNDEVNNDLLERARPRKPGSVDAY